MSSPPQKRVRTQEGLVPPPLKVAKPSVDSGFKAASSSEERLPVNDDPVKRLHEFEDDIKVPKQGSKVMLNFDDFSGGALSNPEEKVNTELKGPSQSMSKNIDHGKSTPNGFYPGYTRYAKKSAISIEGFVPIQEWSSEKTMNQTEITSEKVISQINGLHLDGPDRQFRNPSLAKHDPMAYQNAHGTKKTNEDSKAAAYSFEFATSIDRKAGESSTKGNSKDNTLSTTTGTTTDILDTLAKIAKASTNHVETQSSAKPLFDPHAKAAASSTRQVKSKTEGNTTIDPTKKPFSETHINAKSHPQAKDDKSWTSSAAKKVLPKPLSSWWYGSSSSSKDTIQTETKDDNLTFMTESEYLAAKTAAAKPSSEQWKKIEKEIDPMQKDWVVVPEPEKKASTTSKGKGKDKGKERK